ARELGKAMREIMALADRINHDFDAHQPWILAKDPGSRAELQDVCSRALQGFRLLTVLIAPVLPEVARRVAHELFGLGRDCKWSDADALPQQVNPYRHLMTRVDAKQLDALFDIDKEMPTVTEQKPGSLSAPVAADASAAAKDNLAAPPTISIDEFKR